MNGGRPTVALPVLVSGLEAEMIRLGTRTRRRSGTGAPGAACSGTSLPAASKSSRWTWPWSGSTRPAASSPRSRPGRSGRPTCTCSGSPRCWATTRPTALCCAATPALSAGCLQMRALSSPGSGHGCLLSGARRQCALTGRSPASSRRSRARAAGWPAATPGQSGRSPPRWPDTRPRPSSRSCARLRRRGSLPKRA